MTISFNKRKDIEWLKMIDVPAVVLTKLLSSLKKR